MGEGQDGGNGDHKRDEVRDPPPAGGRDKPLDLHLSAAERRWRLRRLLRLRNERRQREKERAAALEGANTSDGDAGAGSEGPPAGGPPDPYPFGSSDDGARPGERLAAFLVALHNDLHKVVYLRDDLFALPDTDSAEADAVLLAAMADAWDDVDRAIRDQDLVGQVLQADLEQLAAHGLVGRQLDFKLLAWHQNRERMRASFADSDEPDPGPAAEPETLVSPETRTWFGRLRATVPRSLRNGVRYLAKTLAHADVVLGSLTAALPGISGVGDLLTEFKETVEGVAGDRADQRTAGS